MTEALIRALQRQAGQCRAFGSPFSGDLLTLAAADVAAGGPTARLFDPWAAADTREIITDAAPLRLLGALHERVLSGAAPALAAHYPAPGREGDPEAAWRAALPLVAGDAAAAAFMNHEPQTNEVRRSACLLGGFLTVAAETGLPLRVAEIAASAGLNQLWDRYRYDLQGVGVWGDPSSSVRLDTEWRGAPPPLSAPVSVVARAACDRKPADLADPAARLRLKAYIWPDQFDRLARLDSAVALTLQAGTRVEAEDAVTWTARNAAPTAGAATVLFHSVFWQYMPPESQAALAATLARLGAEATADAPFAWLRMEPPPTNLASMEVRLTLWPSGEDRLLATCHPHGAWVEWRG